MFSFHPNILKLYLLLSSLDIKFAWRDLRLLVLIVNVGTVSAEVEYAAENVKCLGFLCLSARISPTLKHSMPIVILLPDYK